MDRLAAEGTRFTNAFVTTSLCSPARASFLTGRYAHAHGIIGNRVEPPDAEMRRAFPALLQQSGYETAYFGKFHMGQDPGPRPGFDEWAALPGQGRYVDPIFNINGETKTLPGHSGAGTTDMTLKWIERERQKPFCLVLGFKEPHGPRTPPEHLRDLYGDVEVPQPSPEPEHLRGKPAAVRERRRPSFVQSRGERTPEQYAEDRRNYWRCITAADEQIGRVLDALDESGLSDNTLVVFAGDNGYFLGEFGLGDKRYGYDASLHIPLIAKLPGRIPANRTLDHMTLNLDLCPTILDYAGVREPDGVHGKSWRPLFDGNDERWRDAFLYEYFYEEQFPHPGVRGLRTQRYKYLHYPDSGDADELYDLERDPSEWNNLADDAQHGPLIERLKSRMETIQAETG